jgi:hypothetical protein
MTQRLVITMQLQHTDQKHRRSNVMTQKQLLVGNLNAPIVGGFLNLSTIPPNNVGSVLIRHGNENK